LLEPTRIYVKPILELMRSIAVKGLAHITGGGIVDNVPRILPEHLTARLKRASWPQPPLFAWLQREGNVADDEMLRVFNCGIGMVIVVAEQQAKEALDVLRAAGETVWRIGSIDQRGKNEAQTIVA
jgi:phosphoribosylformylglycinamidine cyclo-ligase